MARMEDVLEVYGLPYDSEIPLICMDEKPYQLLSQCAEPIPIEPGKPRKEDYEYICKWTCSIFFFTDPLAVRLHVF